MSWLWRLVALGLGLLLAQALVVALFPLALHPDLVLIFGLAMGLRRTRPIEGLLMAFGLGFAFDVLCASPLGTYALLRGTAGAVTRGVDRALYLRAPLPWGLYCGLYALVDAFLLALVLRWLSPEAALPWGEVVLSAPSSALATAVIAGLLLPVFRRIEAEAERDVSWTVLPSPSQRFRP